ncbi:MAG: SLATT domain-containing protein [Bacteroidetes bacterium]|nr:SLATT domain-containing protein [Bacteroidota bacterium]
MDSRDPIESQVRDCYGRVVYSHKTHEKCADIFVKRLERIKVFQIVLSSITTAGFLTAIFGEEEIGIMVGVVVSTVLLGLNTYTKNSDLGELVQKHRRAAVDLWHIREKYLSLITDLRSGRESLDNIMARRDALLKELYGIYSGAQSTTSRAYKKAQKALQKYEEMTFSDDEIDQMLPRDLRRGTKRDMESSRVHESA